MNREPRLGKADDIFVAYRRRYRGRLVVAGGLSVVQACLVVLQPWPLKLAIDHAANNAPLPGWTGPIANLAPSDLAAATALASVMLVLVSGLIGYAETMLVGRVAEALAADIRHGTMSRLMVLSGHFHDRHRSGDLVSRITGDVGRVQDALVASYTVLVPESLTLLGMVLVLLVMDLTLGLIALTAVPFLVAVIVKRRRLVREAQRTARDEAGRLASTATDLVRNVRVIQAFQRQDDSLEQFADRNRAAMDSSVSSMRVDARFSPLGNVVLSVGSASVLWIGVLRVQQHQMSVGTLLIVLSYVGSVYGPVRSLSSLATSLARGAASKDRLREVIDSAVQWVTKGTPVRPEIQIEIGDELTTVGHEGQLHQVAINLIQNALDAMEKSPQPLLLIAGKREGDVIVLTFADNGSGIPEADLDKIFDPFFTTKPVGKGTGLGLSITDAILRDHEGTITASNRKPRGAVFVVALPRANG